MKSIIQNVLHTPSLLLLGTISLFACGGGGGGGGSAPIPELENPTPVASALLKPAASEQELLRSLQTGLQRSAYVASAAEPFDITPIAEDALQPGAGLIADNFSGTNLQEVGVDEADLIKYDGEILYVLASDVGSGLPFDQAFSSIVAEPPKMTIQLFETDTGVPSAVQVGQIELPRQNLAVDGLYLLENDQGKQLVGVGQSSPFVYWELFASDYAWRNNQTYVQAWDVGDPSTPQASWSLSVCGSLLASRRIDNFLYLVTRFSPTVEGLLAYPQTQGEVAANQALINDTSLSELLPKVSMNDAHPTELLSALDCYVPNEAFENGELLSPGGSLITITVVNLEAPDQLQSICLNAWSSGFYASTEAIYVTSNTNGNTTLIHKIALFDSGPEYRGSGEVPGYIGTGNPAFLMSEFDGDLRVVSSKWEINDFPLPVDTLDEAESANPVVDDGFGRHRLTVLRESADGSTLEKIGQLPNVNRPAPIGKPGENVYAARFLGDRAYIVTFEVIDPLYVLDVSNPQDPMITGELEIPGFSTLLQPLGENLLLGVGQHVPIADQPLVQGVKIALFDVANVAAPVSLGEVIIGKRGSYSPALDNHHALTVLMTDGAYRAAIPIQRHDSAVGQDVDLSDPWYWYDWTDSGLYLFDITPAVGALLHSGTIISAARSDDPGNSTDINLYNARSVIHDDAVFFLTGDGVIARPWPE